MPAPEWTRIVNTTIHKYLREVEENTLRNRKLLALLQAKGMISYNHSGDWLDWKVEYKQAPVSGYADNDVRTFPRRNYWQTAQLPWRGYSAEDSMTLLERLKNRNTEAIINIFSQITEMLLKSIREKFGDEFYTDGNSGANPKNIHGLESFFGVSGASTVQPIQLPNDTYAELVCTLGNYGGNWTLSGANTRWPTGTGDVEYDFWSPLIVDYTSACTAANGGWTSTTRTWPNTCREAIRYGILKSQRNKGKDGMLDVILLENELYRQLKDKVEANERVIITRNEPMSLVNLGFPDTISLDGVDITFEYGVPETVGYGVSLANMELCCLQEQLFVPRGPEENLSDLSTRFMITFFGNLKCNPRQFVKFDNATA